MDITIISTLISSVGFPCACVIAMFYMWDREREAHKEEMTKMTDAVNNNTSIIRELISALGGVADED